MSSLLENILLATAIITLLVGAAYLYFVYAPVPDAPTLSASIQEKTIQIDGRTRVFRTYIPANLPPDPALLLVLHGSKIDGDIMRKWTGYEFDELADRYGFLVLYPDGYQKSWNDCRKMASSPAKAENVDDVTFLQTLIEQYRSLYHIQPNRVFVFGYSNGGQMAFRLALDRPQLVGAIATVGANLPVQENCECRWQGSTPRVMLVSNTADKVVPYDGGEVQLLGKSYGNVLSSRATAEHFAERNAPLEPSVVEKITSQQGSNPMPVEHSTWTKPGESKAFIDWYTIMGTGHTIAQSRFRFPRFNGKTATNLDTPLQAITFFGLVN